VNYCAFGDAAMLLVYETKFTFQIYYLVIILVDRWGGTRQLGEFPPARGV